MLRFHLPLVLVLAFPASILHIQSAIAAEITETNTGVQIQEFDRPATTVKEWFAQIKQTENTAAIQVIKVQINRTETGLEIILETQDGRTLQIDTEQFTASGNTLIANIPNAVLKLAEGNEFKAENPTKDISRISINQIDGDRIQISVVGTIQIPTNVTLRTGELAYNLRPMGETRNVEIVVTRTPRNAYIVPNTTTGTRTDTPLRDIPQSIQVVPQQVLEDRQVLRVQQVADSVPGVQAGGNYGGLPSANFFIRGFDTGFVFRDGFRDFGFLTPIDVSNIERIEILKGPASVLYGQGQPGGLVNIVSKQPLTEPYYAASLTIGSFDFYRPTIDISGPLNSQRTVAYRLNLAYENAGSFRDFNESESYFVAPSFSLQLGEDTKMTFNFEYQKYDYTFDRNFQPEPEFFEIPISRFLGEPDFNHASVDSGRASYLLEHQFSENWQLRHRFAAILSHIDNNEIGGDSLQSDRRTLDRYIYFTDELSQTYSIQNEVVGKFQTGAIAHQVLLGVELSRYRFAYDFLGSTIAPIDIFNPVYGAKPEVPFTPSFGEEYGTDAIGVYFQDQVTLLTNLKLLAGGRFDLARSTYRDRITQEELNDTTDFAFSPRLGIVYQPIDPVSLYFSYATSFNPSVFGRSASNEAFEPETGRQFEVGVKADLLSDRLSATLAAFQITKTNVLVTDPDNPDFSIQTGEQTSEGFEFNLVGRPLSGWNITLSYAYTDAFVSEDSTIPVGDKLGGVPEHQAGLFSTYEIQDGSLKGLGVGLGLYYVANRQARLPNTGLKLPDYFRVDASIFYRRNNWKWQVNINNLTDIDYYNSYNGFLVNPQPPLTVLGTVSVEL